MTKLEWLYWGIGIATGAGAIIWFQLAKANLGRPLRKARITNQTRGTNDR